MPLFTIIAEYRGGTYCSQVVAYDINSCLPQWLKRITIEQKEIPYLGERTLAEIDKRITLGDDKPILLTGLKNVCFQFISVKNGKFFINIVQTELPNT